MVHGRHGEHRADDWLIHNYNDEDPDSWEGYTLFECVYSVVDDESLKKDLKAKEMRRLNHGVDKRVREHVFSLKSAKDLTKGKIQVWEVYSGDAQLTQVLRERGCHARSFGLHNGWDFDVKKNRDKFMALLRQKVPDHVFLAPTCGLRSQSRRSTARRRRHATV